MNATDPPPVCVVELTGLDDPLLFPWLDLYETAFPPSEKVLVSDHLRILRSRPADEHLLAAVTGEGAFAGMARWQYDAPTRIAWLWYLATPPETRNRGIGAWIYAEIAGRARDAGARLMLLEVEIPERAGDPEACRFAERRIRFYQRLGAQVLHGIEYWQAAGPFHPPIRMHLMLHVFAELPPADAFTAIRGSLGDDLRQIGELRLE